MNEYLFEKNSIKNNSTENKYSIINITKNKNQKQNIIINGNKKNNIEKNKKKNLYLSKYINKFNLNDIKNHHNNLMTKKFSYLKEYSKNKNKNYINNIRNIIFNNEYINKKSDNNIQNNEFYNNKQTNGQNNEIYNNTQSSFDKKISKYFYCFPDNKFIKVIKKDKIRDNKRLLEYVNIKRKRKIYKHFVDISKLNNYYTDLSNFLKNKNESKSLSTERSKIYNNVERKKSASTHKCIAKQWMVFPNKFEKYIRLKIILNYGNLLFNYLNIIYRKKIEYVKKNKLLCIIKNINKKEKKYYFTKYRDNISEQKINIIYENNFYKKENSNNKNTNIKLRKINPKKINNLENKAKLFISKTPTKINKNKIFILKNIEKFIEKLYFIFYKNNINNHYANLKQKILIINNNKSLNKFINNNNINEISEKEKEKKRNKKHIKIKFIRKVSCPNVGRTDCSLSFKTNSSDISKSTINSTKKMKVYNRIIYINKPINYMNENILELKMTNIILKIDSKEEKQYFSKWKKLTLGKY